MKDNNFKSCEYTFNGKKYGKFEDLPEEAKSILADKDNNGIPDIFENKTDKNIEILTKENIYEKRNYEDIVDNELRKENNFYKYFFAFLLGMISGGGILWILILNKIIIIFK